MSFQSLVFAFLGLYYRLFSQVKYQESQAALPAPKQQATNDTGGNEELPSAPLVDILDRLAMDQFQIAALVKSERYFRDCRQWQKLRNCYHPNASETRIRVGAFKGNIDGFMNLVQLTTMPGLKMIHLIDPVDIDIRGSKGVVVAFETTVNRFEHQKQEFELESLSRIVFRVRKIDGKGWKLCHWDTIYNRDSVKAVDGKTAVPDIGEAGTAARKSYRHLAWLISLKGVKMPMDLSGDDEPNTVADVFKDAAKWLENEA
ncbi:hypothetical protein F4861DRAFT_545640 [Xylaria intraflava]|nr:hypothetical protein F4861DRAFT_545640 [Xylaria intraflava]